LQFEGSAELNISLPAVPSAMFAPFEADDLRIWLVNP
jgi:hypothetical protein